MSVAQDFKRRTPSGSHHVLCIGIDKQHEMRRAAVQKMRVELQLRSSLVPPPTGALSATPLPSAAAPLLLACAAPSRAPATKRKALWVAAVGCSCADEQVHTRHVRKCQKWPCSCKPSRGSNRGGDNTHHEACVRHCYAHHGEPFRLPVNGDRVLMLGDARRMGCPDLVHNGRGWVDDPGGRPLQLSMWMAVETLK